MLWRHDRAITGQSGHVSRSARALHVARMVAIFKLAKRHVGDYPLKNNGSHIDASLSRQPLVKGERLVRAEMNAVINTTAATARYSAKRFVSWLALPWRSVGITASVARVCVIPLWMHRSCAAAEVMALPSRNWRAPSRSKAQRQLLVSKARSLDNSPSLRAKARTATSHPATPAARSRRHYKSDASAARPMIKGSVAPRQLFLRSRRLPAVCAAARAGGRTARCCAQFARDLCPSPLWRREPKRGRGMGSACRARLHAPFSAAALVGSRSQADHLTRNSAMDDSIGGS